MTEIERYCSVGSLIDIGSGMGFSLQVAKARGWTASGIEPNQALVLSAKERRIDVVHGYLSDDAVGQYDVVLIDNVLEHVPDRSEEHTSELQSLMRISYAVFCLNKKKYENHKLRLYHKINI